MAAARRRAVAGGRRRSSWPVTTHAGTVTAPRPPSTAGGPPAPGAGPPGAGSGEQGGSGVGVGGEARGGLVRPPAPARPVGGEHGEAGRLQPAGESVEVGATTGLTVEGQHHGGLIRSWTQIWEGSR